MKKLKLFFQSLAFLELLMIIAACSPSLPTQVSGTPTTNRSRPTATPTSAPTVIPTLTSAPPHLAITPQNCPLNSTSKVLSSAIAPVIGGSPVWATLPTIVHIPSYDTYTSPYGWEWKIIWEIGPGYTHLVTLRGGNLQGNVHLWFQFSGEPMLSPVLDPRQPNHGSALGENWAEFGSYLFIPAADCYYLEATWPGGHWRVTFAAGR